ncbi:lytic murein transglycosylase [Aliiroseovarius sp. KMU-50]|uniref:Lytic murein transglycosylase n=1 Tax=Aliiroseovarius salicola TaxID=3009082 RepID=A0ABT4VWY9_9RHOB|nr:lytic murein transglycosylase [Aliiroseovarius sp. KMU-50]MDA5092760.1 lytic murein transglycosylase [Aliiroseovarius sp. KMU-50]
MADTAEILFSTWQEDFCLRVQDQGIRARTRRVFSEAASYLPDVLDRQMNQKEVLFSVHDYLELTVSDERVRKGRKALRKHRKLMGQIEEHFNVSADAVLAIWGLETGFGANRGNFPVLSALATLAFAGERKAFFESELIAALKIVQARDITPEKMLGSWAGAMGHGQFIPSSYLKYAVDFDGDGKRDIWSDDPTDALASIANYLCEHGWRSGQPCGEEMELPKGFDLSLTGRDQMRPVAEWGAMGVRSPRGMHPADYGEASILLAAGAAGPAYLAYRNFDVFLAYNNSVSYALSVGCLAHRIDGNMKFTKPWPANQRVLSRDETRELQERLTQLGHDTQGADGIAGPNTYQALRTWQQSVGLPADGFPCGEMLDQLREDTPIRH